MSKYIDLYEAMDEDMGLTRREEAAAVDALSWLDENPDQVPGRTITRSEFNKAFSEWFDERDKARIVGIVERLFGITVIPDPEPTNAEVLRRLLEKAQKDNAAQSYTRFAEYLDNAGVKAPEGDDDGN